MKPPAADLDEILALQLTAAWTGEAAGDPKRMGWWPSDLIDPEGGGDLFARLAPKTAPWASLILARKAAMRVDELARAKLAQGDRVRTLFHFGFEVDEALADRLLWHRNQQQAPAAVLGPRFLVGQAWSKGAFEKMLSALPKAKFNVTPSGRQLAQAGESPLEAARLLAAALLPLADTYPLPFVDLGG